jgi:hypothetical protein
VATQEARYLEQNSGWPSKGRPREWNRCGRYPRLDFFAPPECRVVHGSATSDSADKDAETSARPGPTHLSTSGTLSSCWPAPAELRRLLSCYRR